MNSKHFKPYLNPIIMVAYKVILLFTVFKVCTLLVLVYENQIHNMSK